MLYEHTVQCQSRNGKGLLSLAKRHAVSDGRKDDLDTQ